MRTSVTLMQPLPTAAIAAGSLIAGYAVAAATGVRPLGGVVLLAGAAVCAREWYRSAGAPTTAVLLTTYAGAFAVSHPLARLLGAWPSVLTVAVLTGAAAHVLADRRAAAPTR